MHVLKRHFRRLGFCHNVERDFGCFPSFTQVGLSESGFHRAMSLSPFTNQVISQSTRIDLDAAAISGQPQFRKVKTPDLLPFPPPDEAILGLSPFLDLHPSGTNF
jgi:hypothetical protein